jgi:molybdopterin-guanine dinucleotide biosynthesis protein A
MEAFVMGIFVGGASRRMGGRPKGMLPTRSGAVVVDRLRAAAEAAGVSDVVLVGGRSGYASLALPVIEDRPPSIGPLGGLIALLEHASAASARALAMACDMPFISASLVRSLVKHPVASVVAPRRAGIWEPLCAIYRPDDVLAEARQQAASSDHSLQRLLERVAAVELVLQPDEVQTLVDWDTPDDVIEHPG